MLKILMILEKTNALLQILLQIFNCIAITESTLSWQSEFFSMRKQFVPLEVQNADVFRNVRSCLIGVNMGVPQGSVVGAMNRIAGCQFQKISCSTSRIFGIR